MRLLTQTAFYLIFRIRLTSLLSLNKYVSPPSFDWSIFNFKYGKSVVALFGMQSTCYKIDDDAEDFLWRLGEA